MRLCRLVCYVRLYVGRLAAGFCSTLAAYVRSVFFFFLFRSCAPLASVSNVILFAAVSGVVMCSCGPTTAGAAARARFGVCKFFTFTQIWYAPFFFLLCSFEILRKKPRCVFAPRVHVCVYTAAGRRQNTSRLASLPSGNSVCRELLRHSPPPSPSPFLFPFYLSQQLAAVSSFLFFFSFFLL